MIKVGRSAIAGKGLFATAQIARSQRLLRYRGRTVRVGNGRYLMDKGNGEMIDGSPRYNKARYVNHSCKPNCRFVQEDDGTVWLYSRKKIPPGEELTVNYGKSYLEAFDMQCACAHCHSTIVNG